MLPPDEWNQLYRYCYSLTKQPDQAFDLLHSAVEKYLANPALQTHNPKAYIRRIVHNHFIDQYRRQQLVQEEPLTDQTPLDLDTVTLDQIMIDRQELSIIWQSLTSEESELVYLWAAEGMTAQAISDALSVPRGTILSRIHRLRQKLTKLLRPEQDQEA